MKIIYASRKKIYFAVLLILLCCALAFAHFGSFRHTVTVTGAMDTVSGITVYGGISSKKTAEKCADMVREYDSLLSISNPESEIYRFNKCDSSFRFSEQTYALIKDCKSLYLDTDGRFDITVGAASKLWSGAFLSQKLPDEEKLAKASALTDYSSLSFDDDSFTITKSIPNQELNTGAVAKGFISDRIADYLKTADIRGALIDLGGNIYVCGNNGTKKKWSIGIQDPNDPSALVGLIALDNGFVITSGDYQRFMISDGVRYHHILDAKTGYPARSGIRSVTIISDSGFTGDSLSTACFITGLEKGIELVKKNNVYAIFVTENDDVFYSQELETAFTKSGKNFSYTAF